MVHARIWSVHMYAHTHERVLCSRAWHIDRCALCFVGQGPMTGNFGHFMVYAPAQKPEARSYGVVHYGMEVRVGNATSVRVL